MRIFPDGRDHEPDDRAGRRMPLHALGEQRAPAVVSEERDETISRPRIGAADVRLPPEH
jgi:hypothetical protein